MTYWKSSKSIYDQMEAERKITKIYRNTRPYKDVIRPTTIVTPGGQLINLPGRLPKQRSTNSSPRKVVNIQLGTGNGEYNKGGPGHPGLIEGEYRHIGDGPVKPLGSRSAFAMAQLARKIARRSPHPILRGLDYALMAYDLYNFFLQFKKEVAGFNLELDPTITPSGGCNDGGRWDRVVISGIVNNSKWCALSWQVWPLDVTARANFSIQRWNTDPNKFPYRYGDPVAYHDVYGYDFRNRPWPPYQLKPAIDPWVPLLSQPLPHNATDAGSGYKPPTPPVPQKLRSRPPGPGVKERKGEMPGWAMNVMKGVWAATEAIDAIDAIWKALPKDIRDATPKTGRTRKGALIGEGKAYSTPLDKAKHLYDNLDKLDLPEAIKNLIINHYTDALMGRFHGTVDKARRRAGGTGWGAAWT